MDKPTKHVFVLSREEMAVAGAGATKEILMGPVPTGKVWRLGTIGMENENGTTASVELRVKSGEKVIPYDYFVTFTAGVPQFSSGMLLLPENTYLSALFTTNQAATNLLHLYVNGAEGPDDIPELVAM